MIKTPCSLAWPNGWRVSGERKRVRCTRLLGVAMLDTLHFLQDRLEFLPHETNADGCLVHNYWLIDKPHHLPFQTF